MSSRTDASETRSGDSALDQTDKTHSPFLTLVAHADRIDGSAMQLGLLVVSELTIGRGEADALEVASDKPRGWRWSIDDGQSSRDHARVFYRGNGWRIEDLGSKNGTLVNAKRVPSIALRSGDWIRVGATFFLFQHHAVHPDDMGARTMETDRGDPLATLVPSLVRHFSEVIDLAPTTLPILISGETGTGKELIANELHRLSGRRGSMISVNCGAIPTTLVESELFGHRRGAFSGAIEDRRGLIRAADNGTLLLDEIGELPESAQVALLRVLQEGEVRPVGSTKPIAVDVRVVAATHQDLEAAVEAGRFREDLYARLAGTKVDLPPLRQRREDLGIIVSRLLKRYAGEHETIPTFSKKALQLVLAHDYPRNVRELEHAIKRAVALARGKKISARHLPSSFVAASTSLDSRDSSPEEAALRDRLKQVLSDENGNISAAARVFGKAPIQIRRWCERFDIDFSRYRNGS